jgi:hypothetical protein
MRIFSRLKGRHVTNRHSGFCLAFGMLVGQLFVTAACGGSGSPSSPGVTPAGSTTPACRTYSTADSRTITSTSGVNGTLTSACVPYNKSSNELSCVLNYADNRGTANTTSTRTTFASVAEFVGDAPRVFIYSTSTVHPLSLVSTMAGTTTNVAYTYDSQGRLTRFSALLSGGGSEVLTFSTWDTFGRPTAAVGSSTAFVYTYDDSARTATIANGQGGTIAQNFDSNGILVRQVSVVPGGATETQTWTIQSTDTVCRTGNS